MRETIFVFLRMIATVAAVIFSDLAIDLLTLNKTDAPDSGQQFGIAVGPLAVGVVAAILATRKKPENVFGRAAIQTAIACAAAALLQLIAVSVQMPEGAAAAFRDQLISIVAVLIVQLLVFNLFWESVARRV